MPETITPVELAKELNLDPRTVRQFCRDQGWQSVAYARWHLSADQARRVRQHFGR